MSAVLDLAMDLVGRPSVTPADAGCQHVVAGRLARAGFAVERLRYGEVDNLWACHGRARPLLVFLGHTDVVPPGPLEAWSSDPFRPEVREGVLYGRGAADMKGAVAAMVVAAERFLARHPAHAGSLGLLLTSDEEGVAVDGTVKVVRKLVEDGVHIDWCLVGEPSSRQRLGDTVKNGRRGSLNGVLTVRGVQGHVAYPHRALNPIHLALPALQELVATRWDEGTEFYPPTSFQLSNLQSGTGAENVIPGSLRAMFNFRFNTLHTEASLRARVAGVLARHGLDTEVEWRLSGLPFVTGGGALLEAATHALREVLGVETELSTDGGTSDGRFVAPTGAQVIELGPLNATIHRVDECVPIADLDALALVYESILERLLGTA